MLPRFVNPHTVSQSTLTISRDQLYENSDDNEIPKDPDVDALATLEKLVKRSLGGYHSDVFDDSVEPRRKKKRRRIEGGHEAEISCVTQESNRT